MATIPGMPLYIKPFSYPPWEQSLDKYMENPKFKKIHDLLLDMGFSCQKSNRHHPDYILDSMAPPPLPAKFTKDGFDYYYLMSDRSSGTWFGPNKFAVSKTIYYSDRTEVYYRTEFFTWEEMLDKFPMELLDILIFNLDKLSDL